MTTCPRLFANTIPVTCTLMGCVGVPYTSVRWGLADGVTGVATAEVGLGAALVRGLVRWAAAGEVVVVDTPEDDAIDTDGPVLAVADTAPDAPDIEVFCPRVAGAAQEAASTASPTRPAIAVPFFRFRTLHIAHLLDRPDGTAARAGMPVGSALPIVLSDLDPELTARARSGRGEHRDVIRSGWSDSAGRRRRGRT